MNRAFKAIGMMLNANGNTTGEALREARNGRFVDVVTHRKNVYPRKDRVERRRRTERRTESQLSLTFHWKKTKMTVGRRRRIA
jgi:hypothetical protein